MSDEVTAGAGGEYEFTAEQNRTIEATGTRAQWWGAILVVFGLLFASIGFWVIAFEGLSSLPGAVAIALIASIPFFIGMHFVRAGRSLAAVVATEGHDVSHLMGAIHSLGSALLVQLIAMSIWMLVLVAGMFSARMSFVDTRDKAYVAAQKSDLRNLASLQEMYFADSGDEGGVYAYTGNLGDIDFPWSEGVTVTLLSGGPDGWSARSSHVALPEIECVVYVGDAPPPSTSHGTTASTEGTIVCDG